MYRIFKVVTGMLQENCYFLCNNKNECVIVDPGDDFEKIRNAIVSKKLTPLAVILTHGHYDHIDGITELKNEFPIPIYMNRNDEFFTKDKFYVDYDSAEVENINGFNIKAIHTPGHSKGSTCYLLDENLFTGDTLFCGTIGRCDFDGGSFHDMQKSLEKIVAKFDDQIRVFPGHGPQSTIGAEKLSNPYLINLKKY